MHHTNGAHLGMVMKLFSRVVLMLSLLGIALNAQAQNASERIVFRGSAVDGPFANKTINGHCDIRLRGDSFDQTTKCVVKLDNGFRIVDRESSVQVVGSNRALRIILGPTMND